MLGGRGDHAAAMSRRWEGEGIMPLRGHDAGRIRYRKDKMMTKQTPTFPAVTGVKDLSNGCAIAAAVHHYCPDILRLEDVCLKETMSVADSLYNLQLIQEFCKECLGSCCPLALEDLLYTPPVLKRF
ncbi:UNVERIFIED_CONTAM: hypothetical protein FKN15_057370 [Acipenser sinensis]